MRDIAISFGWLDAEGKNKKLFQKKAAYLLKEYEDSVYLRSYKPNVMFSIACATWDFSTEITFGDAVGVLSLLKESIAISKTLKKDQMGIYSVLGLELISARDFILEVQKTITAIEKRIGSFEDVSAKNPKEVILSDKIYDLKLFLVNI